MKNKLFAFLTVFVLFLNLTGLSFADTRRDTSKIRQTAALIALLPASDGVATLDARRLFDNAIPTILSANQPMLAAITAKLGEVESKTGIDLRKFDQIVVGVATKKVSAKDVDFDPVAIARGDVTVGSLIGVVKLASSGTYHEEKVGDRTIYIFSAREVTKNAVKATNAKVPDVIDKAIDGLTHEIAVAAIDRNTLAFGSPARVRQTLEGKTKVGSDVLALLPHSETAVAASAMRSPGAMSSLLPMENDELGANIDSIRYIAGSLNVAAAGTELKAMVRTATPDQAQSLLETL